MVKKDEKVKEEVETTETVVEETPKETPKKTSKTSVTVAYDGTSREYSKAVHGDDFEALAQEFATKRNGKIV